MKEQMMEISIDISVYQPQQGNGSVRITEKLNIPAKSFLEVCKVLSQFQELADKIRKDSQ